MGGAGSRKGEPAAFRAGPFPTKFGSSEGQSGSSSPAGPLLSALSASREATPTHRAGPSSASPPPSTSYLPAPLRPPASFPGLWHSTALSSKLLPTPQTAPGPGWGDALSWRGGHSEATTEMRKTVGGGCVGQPGMSAYWECTNPGIQASAEMSPPITPERPGSQRQ